MPSQERQDGSPEERIKAKDDDDQCQRLASGNRRYEPPAQNCDRNKPKSKTFLANQLPIDPKLQTLLVSARSLRVSTDPYRDAVRTAHSESPQDSLKRWRHPNRSPSTCKGPLRTSTMPTASVEGGGVHPLPNCTHSPAIAVHVSKTFHKTTEQLFSREVLPGRGHAQQKVRLRRCAATMNPLPIKVMKISVLCEGRRSPANAEIETQTVRR